jgi:hypothetical protein
MGSLTKSQLRVGEKEGRKTMAKKIKNGLIFAIVLAVAAVAWPKTSAAQDAMSTISSVSFDDGRPKGIVSDYLPIKEGKKCAFYLSFPLIPGVYVSDFGAFGNLGVLGQLANPEELKTLTLDFSLLAKTDTKIKFGILSRHFNVKFEGGAEGAGSGRFWNELDAEDYTNKQSLEAIALANLPAKVTLEHNLHLGRFVIHYGVGVGYKYRRFMAYTLNSELGVDIPDIPDIPGIPDDFPLPTNGIGEIPDIPDIPDDYQPDVTNEKEDEFLQTYGHGFTLDAHLVLDWTELDTKKYIQAKAGIVVKNAYSHFWYQKNDFGLWDRDPRQFGFGIEVVPYRILTLRFNLMADAINFKPEYRVEASRWVGPAEFALGGVFNERNLLGDYRHLGYFNLGLGNKYVVFDIYVSLDQYKRWGGFLTLKLGYNVDKIL